MLGRLNHPCVVALIGVSIQPLCIVLELSPLGSLYSILEKAIEKLESEKFQPSIETAQDVRKPIFDRYLTYKIIYQVKKFTSKLNNTFVTTFKCLQCLWFVSPFCMHLCHHAQLMGSRQKKFSCPKKILPFVNGP